MAKHQENTLILNSCAEYRYMTKGVEEWKVSTGENINPYDLAKQEFQVQEENSCGDVMDSPYESWIPQVFDAISRTAE